MKLLDAINASNCGVAGRVTKQKTIARVRLFPNGKLRKIASLDDPRYFEMLLPQERILADWLPVDIEPGKVLPIARPGRPRKNGAA